jgi:hypothetical protein
MFDFTDEAFNKVPFFVEMLIIVSLHCAVLARRNDRDGTPVKDTLNKVVRVIATVGKDVVALADEANREVLRLSNVIALATRQNEEQRITQRIGDHMDFGAEAASTSTQGLLGLTTVFLSAPAAQAWALTTVLSRIRFSMSGISMKCRCICSQLPLSLHRAKRLYTLFQLPYSAGSNRHWAPLRSTHNTPSTNRRQAASSPMYMLLHVRRKSSIFDHCSSVSLTFMGHQYALISSNVNRT